jgi:hypothetical protein
MESSQSDAWHQSEESMCYKKDIIAVFAYEFELLHKIMKSLLMQG